MLKPLKTFFRFKRQDRALVLRAMATMVISLVRLRAQGVEEVQLWAARPGNGVVEAKRLAWAVMAASRRVPRATCLVQALTLQHLLSKNGHGSELIIGVDNSEGQFSAHAWLVFDGEILIGDLSFVKYKCLSTWSTQDRFSSSRLSSKKAI
jgi:hypothetical protein